MKMFNREKEDITSDQKRRKFILEKKRSLPRIINDEYLPNFPAFNVLDAGNKLSVIEARFRCKINCWRTLSSKAKWECIRPSPFMEDSSYDTEIDIIVEYNPATISLLNVGLILDIDETLPEKIRFKRERWSIFEAIALFKNPDLESKIVLLRQETQKLQTLWGRKSVHTINAKEFFKTFKVSLQIWKTKQKSNGKVERTKLFDTFNNPKIIGKVLRKTKKNYFLFE